MADNWLKTFHANPVDHAIVKLPRTDADAPAEVAAFFEGLQASGATRGLPVAIDAVNNLLAGMTREQFETIFEALCGDDLDRVHLRLPWDIDVVQYRAALRAIAIRHPSKALLARVSMENVFEKKRHESVKKVLCEIESKLACEMGRLDGLLNLLRDMFALFKSRVL